MVVKGFMNQHLPASSNRIEFIDVLRGFTLFGIGIIHMVEQYFAQLAPQSHQNFQAHSLGDQITSESLASSSRAILHDILLSVWS